MKRKHFTLALLAFMPFVGHAQWTRNAVNGWTFLTNTGDYLGIGTTLGPVFPGNKFEVVSGGVMLQSTAGGRVRFENPNGEEGMSVHTSSNSARADYRVDGTSLKIGYHNATGAVPASNLMFVTGAGKFGIATSTPGAKFEINSGAPGTSGLRFTLLNGGSTAAGSNGKVLTLSPTGDVVLATDSNNIYTGGSGINVTGNVISSSLTGGDGITITSGVINSTWIAVGSDIANTNTGGVAVGSSTLLPDSRLSVTGSATNRIGIVSELSSVLPGAGLPAVGVQANVTGNFQNEGFHAKTSGGDFSTGGIFEAAGSNTVTTGVQGWADGGTGSTGGFFWGKNANSTVGASGAATGDSLSGSSAKAGTFVARDAGSVVGVNAEALSGPGNVFNYGVNAAAFQSEGNYNYGVKSSAQTHPDAIRNAGVYTIAAVTGNSNTCTNYGVFSMIDGSSATAPNPANGAGSYAGYFWDNSSATNATGSAFFNGVIVSSVPGVTAVSDRKFKNNITPIESSLGKIMELTPVSYTFKSKSQFPSFTFPAGKQLGFVAQDLEKVFPEIVHESVNPAQYDDKGNKIADKVEFKGVDYTSLIPVLTRAIQEQQAQIEEQQKQIDELKKAIANSGNSLNTDNKTDISAKGYLSQNVPNPFTQNTVISYSLPQNAKSAAIGVYDMNGREIKLLSLGAETTGSVTIDGGSMQAGMYIYTLIVNGLPFETKKMLLTSH